MIVVGPNGPQCCSLRLVPCIRAVVVVAGDVVVVVAASWCHLAAFLHIPPAASRHTKECLIYF